MKILVFILLSSFTTLYAKDNVQSINLQEVSTKGLDKNVVKVFKQTKKLIIQARKTEDNETEILASQKWCLLLHNYQFYNQAQACYRYVGMQQKSKAKWPYLYAKVSMEKGEFKSSSEGLDETLRRNNNYLPAHYYKIKQAIERNQLAQAFEYLDAVPIALRLTSNLLDLQGDLYFATENYLIAIGFYQQSLLLVPRAKSLNYKIAKSYQNLGLMQQAEKYINLASEIVIKLKDPYYQEVKNTIVGEIPFLIKAKTALINNDRELAIKLYQKALKFNPNSETALVNMAVAYFTDKQYDLATESLEKVLNINPLQNKALFNLAVIQFKQKNWVQAFGNFKKLYAMNNSDEMVNYYLAQIFYQQKEYLKVIEIAQTKVMQVHVQTQYLKAKSLIQLQRYAQAVEWLNEINKNKPNDFNVILSLAKLYSQVPDKSFRRPQLALNFAKQALSLKTNAQSQWQMIIALDENKNCQQLKDQMLGLSQTLNVDSKNVYVNLVQQRGQDLNCTIINDKP